MRRAWVLLLLGMSCRGGDESPAPGVVVAAIQGPERGCAEPACGLEALVRRAARAGAKLIVTPEYAIDIPVEPSTPVGQVPDDRSPVQRRFARLSSDLGVLLFLQLATEAEGRIHNSLVALDGGRVLAVHHKFELYGAEKRAMTAGDEATVVSTRFGEVGMLVCADLYGEPALHEATARADLVVVASQWTVPGAPRWPAAFAHDWGVPVVAANSSHGGAAGGGIFDREGRHRGDRLSGYPIDLHRLELP